MGRIIIGNCFSLVGSCFMAASCMTRSTRKIFFYQFLECVLVVIASFFFGSLSGAATMVLSAVRNLLVSRGKYSRRTMLTFCVLSLSADQIIADITACNEKIKAVTGVSPTLFRPPYGEYDDHVVSTVRGMGLEIIQWDVETLAAGAMPWGARV